MSTISAFILAAGEGRRLRPATLFRPKALVPFCGVPLLELVTSYLNELGMSDIVVNASYQGDRVYETCQRLQHRHGWDLRVSAEPRLLNQGGGLRYGIRLIPDAENILVHNVDVILDYDLRQLIAAHTAQQAAVTVLLIPNRGPCSVSLDGQGKILRFRDPKHGRYTFSGIHIFRRDVLNYLDPNDEAPDIIDAYQRALDAGEKVQAIVASRNVYWSDIGTAAEYIRAHGEIADCSLGFHSLLRKAQTEQAHRRFELELKGVQCTGALGIGLEVGVPAGSQIHNVVLWDYTRLPRPLLYADGIFIGDDVRPPKPVDDTRQPDSRVFLSLGIESAACTLTPLAKQGSGRKYSRLSCGDRSWVWCAYNPDRRENAGFSAISDFLFRLGIRVPQVMLHLADTFEIVSRDLGQSDLQLAPQQLKEEYLFQVVEQIARLHVLGDQAVRLEELPLQKGFTKGLYDWERDYFRNNMLDACLHAPELWADAALEYCELRSILLRQPLVPIHRDLQSANIKVKDGLAYLIDFQGMRLGSAAYDLGSLLYDPYQCYPVELRQAAWREYCRQVRSLGGTPPEYYVLLAAACQRLMQALGAYGKLWIKDGLEWYRQFICPGFDMLVEAAAEGEQFPALRAMAGKGRDIARRLLQKS
ncbi:MAG: NTP transferase domain-containing protein [Lentisphaerae bacterium]|nr:NTP transferase domain-containing protein [Lentisphaerota bacterium]